MLTTFIIETWCVSTICYNYEMFADQIIDNSFLVREKYSYKKIKKN